MSKQSAPPICKHPDHVTSYFSHAKGNFSCYHSVRSYLQSWDLWPVPGLKAR